jgi:hypothetical protein
MSHLKATMGLPLKVEVGQSVVDDCYFVFRVAELADDLLLNHARIRDHLSCATSLKQGSLQIKDFGVLVVRPAKESAPTRFVRRPTFQPEFMDPVPGSIAVALHDAIQAKEDLVWSPASLNGFCEPERAQSIGADDRPVRPFGLRPISCGMQNRLVAGICQRSPEPFQITLRAARRGESASNKTNLHEVSQAPFADRGNRELKVLGFLPNVQRWNRRATGARCRT